MRITVWSLMMLVGASLFLPEQAKASTLETVQEEGVLRCGVRKLGTALSYINENGRWSGFYPEICRSIAAAVVNDPEAVEFVVTGSADRFENLQNDEFDVLVESTTWTLSRDAKDMTFMPMFLFDGQGFLYYKPSGIKTLKDLTDKRICVEDNTTSIANLIDYNAENNVNWDIRPFKTMQGAFNAFFERQCDAISTDVLITASMRKSLAVNPEDYGFLKERISKEPLSAVVRSNDAQWADIVRWVINSLVNAEELGITSKNIMDMRSSSNPAIKNFLGIEGDVGKKLGLDERWAERAVRASGNYGEIYAKTLTEELGLERGINNLWTNGGLIWSPPMR